MAYVPFNLKPVDEIDYQQRVQNEILNTRKRLSAVGQDDLVMPPKNDQALPKIFEYLLRSGHAATGLVSEVLAPGIGETPGEFDPLQALKRGYMGEEKLRTKDILTDWGVSDNPWFDKEILNVRVAPSTAGVAGFVGDVLNPFDPLNWLTLGTGKAAAGAAQGMPLLTKALGQNTAEQVASHLSPEIVGGLKGATTGDLVNNIINKFPSLTDEQVNNIRGLLNTAQGQGLNLKTKLPTDTRHLTAGLQIPLVNTRVLPQTRIPGTAPVVTSVSNAMNRLGKNKLVDDFKKKFMPGYVSPLDTKDVYKVLRGLEGQPGVEGSTLNEAQEFLNSVVKGTEDSVRYQAGEGEKYLSALFDGMSKDRQSELLYQVSPAGSFTKLFDTYGKSAVDEIQKLGYSQPEALAAKAFHDLRGTIAKTFNDNQIPMDEMWSWVPMILNRKPNTGESAAIKLAFGGKDYVPQTLDNDLLNLVAKQYPNMLQRQLTFGAGSPQEVNAVLKGAGYKPIAEDHLYNVMSTVNERFIRAVETKKAVDKIVNQYGLKPEDLQAGGMRSLPDGYEVFRVATDKNTGKIVFNPVDATEHATFMGGGNVTGGTGKPLDTSTMFAMPKDFARVWKDYQAIHYNESSGALYKFLTKATSQFRTLSYMVTPGHIPRDFASNMYNLWLMGMRTPKHLGASHSAALDLEKNIIFPTSLNRDNPPSEGWSYLIRTASGKLKVSNTPVDGEFEAFVRSNRAGNVERRLNKTISTPNGAMPMYDVLREANSRGVIDTGWWATEGPETAGMKAMSKAEKAKSWVTTLNPQKHPWTQFFVRQTKLTDNTSRIMGFVDNLQKGDDLGTAATKVKTYLFDYSELTPFEQKVMRNVIPFYCLSLTAEALTRSGWKKHDEVVVGEEILTYNINTQQTEWKPILNVLSSPYQGNMMHFKGKSMDTLCTPDHKWIVRRVDGTHNPELKEAWRIRTNYRLTLCGEYNAPSRYDIPDPILWLIGWLSTDGHIRQKGNYWEYVIYQKKSFVDEIRNVLDRLGGEYGECQHPNGTAQFYLKGTLKERIMAHYKSRDDLWNLIVQLDTRQLDILYDAMYKADGTQSGNNCSFFAKESGPIKDAFQLLCYLRGKLAKLTERGMYIRKEVQEIKYSALDVQMVDYTGTVWCPRTENETWVARDNGYIFATGNTWLRKNIPLQIKESLKQPGKLATAGKYHEGISEEITPENTPRYLQKQASMLLPGGESYLTPPMPYQDLGRLPLSLEGMMEQLSNVNPLFRVPVEMAINKKFFSGLPIENYPDERADKNNGALGELLGQSGIPWVDQKRGLNYILDNIPLYRNVTTMAPLADPRIWGNFNEEVANSPDLTRDYNKLLSFLIGPQLAASGRAKEIATYEERDRLRAIIRLLKDQGMEIPDVRDLR